MKLTFVLVDDSGQEHTGSVVLTPASGRKASLPKGPPGASRRGAAAIPSLDQNPRALMKKLGRRLKGPGKFTLLVARLVKGDVSRQIGVDEIQSLWNRMTGVMGGKFSTMYGTRAREYGWVDSPKRGVYILTPSWKEVLDAVNE